MGPRSASVSEEGARERPAAAAAPSPSAAAPTKAYRSESEFPAGRQVCRVGDVLQQPGELAAGKIRVEQKSGLGSDEGFMTGFLEPRAQSGRAPILPDNGAMERTPGRAVP